MERVSRGQVRAQTVGQETTGLGGSQHVVRRRAWHRCARRQASCADVLGPPAAGEVNARPLVGRLGVRERRVMTNRCASVGHQAEAFGSPGVTSCVPCRSRHHIVSCPTGAIRKAAGSHKNRTNAYSGRASGQPLRPLAGELGLVVSELRRRSASGRQGAEAKRTLSFDRGDSISRFRGVTPHRGKWLARSPGGEHCGTYASQDDAARAVARFLKVPLRSLRRGGPSQRVLRQTFRAAYSVFRGYCPGDWSNLEEQEVKSACMFREA